MKIPLPISVIALVVLFSAALPAQQVKPQGGTLCETKLAAVPTSLTVVAPASSCPTGATDVHIRQITVFIPSTSTATVTLADRQGSPISFGTVTASATGITYLYSWPVGSELLAASGFTIQATSTGATFQAVWLQ